MPKKAMTTSTLEQLYDLVHVTARKFRKKFPDSDEKELRNIIEESIPNGAAKEWKRDVTEDGIMYLNFSDKVLDLPEKTISGRGETKLIKRNHYLIQIFRIPLNYEPTLLNIMLVAFFSGQLMARFVQSEFPEGLVKACKNLRFHSLLNFINDTELDEISSNILQETIDVLKKKIAVHLRDFCE
jgi:hypothetical protein